MILANIKHGDICNNSQWKKPLIHLTQSAFTCSKLRIEDIEQGVKYVQS